MSIYAFVYSLWLNFYLFYLFYFFNFIYFPYFFNFFHFLYFLLLERTSGVSPVIFELVAAPYWSDLNCSQTLKPIFFRFIVEHNSLHTTVIFMSNTCSIQKKADFTDLVLELSKYSENFRGNLETFQVVRESIRESKGATSQGLPDKERWQCVWHPSNRDGSVSAV